MVLKIRRLGTLCLLLVLWGCSESLPGFDAPSPGTYEHILNTRLLGFRRSYLIHIPAGYDGRKALPLVVALHGGFGTARKMEEESGLSALADREGFMVLYPNGMTLFGRLQHWNAGHCCGIAMHRDVDDVGFLSRCIDQVRSRLPVDTSRIYMVGYSNGGMLAYLFAAKRPETLAAFAVIAASIGSRPSPSEPEKMVPPPAAAVPLIAFHGREDDLVPYAGGTRTKEGYLYVSVNRSTAFWVKANHGTRTPARERMMNGKVAKDVWNSGDARREVILYSLEGWNHHLPTRRFTHSLPEADPLRDFDAAEIICAFFKAHHRY
ncbi:MAG: alpha/beta fold hydrolase [Thermodesulfobacteriota bacterium]